MYYATYCGQYPCRVNGVGLATAETSENPLLQLHRRGNVCSDTMLFTGPPAILTKHTATLQHT